MDNKDNQDNGDFEDNEDMKMIGTLMIERHQCDDAHDEEDDDNDDNDDDNDDDNNDDNDDENMMNLRAGQSGTRSLKSFIATHGQSPVLIVDIVMMISLLMILDLYNLATKNYLSADPIW